MGEQYSENDQMYNDPNSVKSDPFNDEAGTVPDSSRGGNLPQLLRALRAQTSLACCCCSHHRRARCCSLVKIRVG